MWVLCKARPKGALSGPKADKKRVLGATGRCLTLLLASAKGPLWAFYYHGESKGRAAGPKRGMLGHF